MTVFKNEVYKSFRSRSFQLSLGISMLIVCWHLFDLSGLMTRLYLEAQPGRFTGRYNLFYWWIAIDSVTVQYTLLYHLFPLLASMPFAWSLAHELKTGYANQMILRYGSVDYYVSKYFALLLSGGAVVAIPLTIDLFSAAMFSPAILPDVSFAMPGFQEGNFLSAVYYQNPWLFCFAFLFLDFIWGGTIAGLSILFTALWRSEILATVLPTVLVYIEDILSVFITITVYEKTGSFYEFSILHLFHAWTANLNPAWLQISIISLLNALSFSAALLMSRQGDRL